MYRVIVGKLLVRGTFTILSATNGSLWRSRTVLPHEARERQVLDSEANLHVEKHLEDALEQVVTSASLVVTSASLVATSALLVVTRSY